jgi:hypothetical protein
MALNEYALYLAAAAACIIAPGCYAQAEQKAEITCRVLDDIESKGVARARTSLAPAAGGERITAFTSETGACALRDIPPGDYVLTVEKAGFFPITGLQSIAFTAVAPKTDLGEIVLSAMRSIQGSVRWKNGDPADNVIAHALLVRGGRGVFRPGDARLSITNERGEFRLEGLRPATYLLYSYTLGFRPDLPGRPALPVFYPDLPAPNLQAGIDLRKTKEATGLTLTLQDTEGVTVRGIVTPSSTLPQGSPMSVGLMIPDNPAQPFAGAQTESGKPFQLQGIPPGNYILIMVEKSGLHRSAVPLTVGTSPIADMRFTFTDPRELECNFEYDVAQPGTQTASTNDLSTARLWAMAEPLQMFGMSTARPDPEGHVRLKEVVAGYRYQLHIEPPAGSYIASVKQAETELTQNPPQASADDGRVRIILRRDGGTLNGLITDKNGKPTAGFAVLVPADQARQYWLKTAQAASNGRIEITAIAPGKYRLFILPDNDNDSYLDEKYLEKFESKEVSIKANSKQALEVRAAAK